MFAQSRAKIAVAGAVTVVAMIAAAWWWVSMNREIQSVYTAAAADCENGQGAGLLRAADAIYGKDARPRQLRLILGNCSLTDAVESYERAKAAVDALNN